MSQAKTRFRKADALSPAGSAAIASSELAFLADKIELVDPNSLTPYAGNPRKHKPQSIDKLAIQISNVGFFNPILATPDGIVIAGHARLLAAKKLGLKRVPTICISHLTPEEVRAVRLADNKFGDLSCWDEEALAIELKELIVLDPSTEIVELSGFELVEIEAAIAVLDEPTDRQDPADPIIEPAGPRVSQEGDLWHLGPHSLLCGSSLAPDSYEKLLHGIEVRAVWADPPYNVAVNGHVSGLGKTKHREFLQASGEMSEEEFTDFLASYLALAKQHSMPGALHYACMDGAHGFELLTAARRAKLAFKATCTWAKTSAGMGSLYRQQTEFVHVFKNGGNDIRHINNVQLGRYGRSRTTLWTYRGVNSFGRGRMDDLTSHPTVKPWAMVADAIKDCTNLGDSVLDPFCGSGTTIIAAEKVGRTAYGIELDPIYVDVAIRRWEKMTKIPAVHAQMTLTFAEMAALRANNSDTSLIAASAAA